MTAQTEPSLRRGRLAATVAFSAQGFALAILVTRVPTIKAYHGLSDLDLGLLLVLVPVLAGVGTVIAGVLAPRVGSAAVLRVSGPLVPLSVVGVGFAPSVVMLVAALSILGVAVGATDATMNMQGVAVQHAYGRPIISSCYAWFSLFSIVGALLAAGAAEIDMPLGVFFGVCAVVVVPVQLVVARYLMADAPDDGHGASVRVPWAPVLVIGVALMGAYILDSAAQNWSAVFLTDATGSSESVAALAYGVYSLVLLLGRMAVDRLDMRFGPVALVRAGSAIALVAVLVIAAAPTPVIALAGFGLLGLAIAPMMPLAFTAAAAHDPERTGKAIARVNIFNYLGVLLGAPLVGAISEASSLRVAFAVLAVAPLITFALAKSFRASTL